MRRDPRLHGLTTDHHHALRLAWHVRHECEAGRAGPALTARVRAAFDRELAQHFAVEEEVLLKPLGAAGGVELVDRTLREHAMLREHLAEAERGDPCRLAAFADLLTAHVRFEENELFPACEARLSSDALEEAARRAPKDRPRAV